MNHLEPRYNAARNRVLNTFLTLYDAYKDRPMHELTALYSTVVELQIKMDKDDIWFILNNPAPQSFCEELDQSYSDICVRVLAWLFINAAMYEWPAYETTLLKVHTVSRCETRGMS